ncbi:MAG: YqgE/AlgH family protein [Actinomycetota bacterium]|nr:YqgE/AlgH family protein [Actinomycetota bacterium]
MDSLRGKLLLSAPNLFDPNFRRTVLLIAEHTDDGAMGVVLNRPAEVTVGEAVPDLAWLTVSGEDPIYAGGPVATDSVVILAEFEQPGLAAALILKDVGFVPAETDDPDELASGVRRSRVFAGHAGWGPGQLDAELDENSWIVEPALPEDVFADDPDALWAAVMRRKGREFRLLANMPLDPSLN